MKTEQAFSKLVEPFKKLITHTKPAQSDPHGWMSFVQVGDVKMSVDLATNGIYTFVITREPDLGLKVSVDKRFKLYEIPVVIGEMEVIVTTAIEAITKLKEDGNA